MTQLAIVILATDRLELLARFYGDLTGWPRLVDEEVYVEFEAGAARLGVYAAHAFGRNLGDGGHDVTGATPSGALGRTEVYLEVDDVDEAVRRAEKGGGRLLSPEQPRVWGQSVAYVADPDGNICALARADRPAARA